MSKSLGVKDRTFSPKLYLRKKKLENGLEVSFSRVDKKQMRSECSRGILGNKGGGEGGGGHFGDFSIAMEIYLSFTPISD